ncbi:MAG: hypothetical protein GY807_12710 [Gammaproteobacteria bacterium]|nr:hypothetical protein [Gammaproteobacteria bacterium]
MTVTVFFELVLTPIGAGIGAALGLYLVTRFGQYDRYRRPMLIVVAIVVAAISFYSKISSNPQVFTAEPEKSFSPLSEREIQEASSEIEQAIRKHGLVLALQMLVPEIEVPQDWGNNTTLVKVESKYTTLIYSLDVQTTADVWRPDFSAIQGKHTCAFPFLKQIHDNGGTIEQVYRRKADDHYLGTVATNSAICESLQ